MTKMLEINTTKCRMYFTEEELFSLMSQDKDLLTTGIQRGKAFKRAADQKKRLAEKRGDQRLITTATIFCLNCGSTLIDVAGWKDGGTKANVYCSCCGQEADIKGFTLGRVLHTSEKNLGEAVKDAAVYKRNPLIKNKIIAQAKKYGA